MPVDLAVTCSVHCWYNRKNGSLPHILILDEVLSVGDGAFRKKSEAKMREIIAGGATTILVSHFLAQVRELCTKVLWLEKGGQTAAGDTKILSGWYQKYLDKQITLEQGKNAWNRLNEHYDYLIVAAGCMVPPLPGEPWTAEKGMSVPGLLRAGCGGPSGGLGRQLPSAAAWKGRAGDSVSCKPNKK